MYYKRDEAFRYTFGTPLPGTAELEETTNHSIDTKILDISLHGMKISFDEEIDLKQENTIYIQFQLSEQNFHTKGKIIWNKNHLNSIECGVILDNDDEWKRELTNALKLYAKNHR